MAFAFLESLAFAWLFGMVPQFLFVVFMSVCFPRVTQILVYFVLGPIFWLGAIGITMTLLWLGGYIPYHNSAGPYVAAATFIPISAFTHYIARGLSHADPRNWA